MSDDDARPRPQYGEYASPEEQRARIQRPEVTEALEAGVAPAPEPVAEAAPAANRARGPLADRVATFVLLVYGLISVISTVTQLLDFPGYAERAAQILGVDATYTALSTGYVWGAVASVVYAIGYLLTAVMASGVRAGEGVVRWLGAGGGAAAARGLLNRIQRRRAFASPEHRAARRAWARCPSSRPSCTRTPPR